jgi:major membrane immunogen (membrane-anchored lipoprotein)
MGIKHVVAGAMVVASGLLLSACDWGDFADNKFSDQESLDQSVSEVRFSNDSGDVKITVGDTLEVRRTVGYGDTKPGKTYRVDGDALVLEACQERGCWVSYDVTVPEGAKVSGHLDSGNVELIGVASANVETESGELTVRDVAGEVNASAQSGNVDLSNIGGTVVAGAQSGNVTIGVTKAVAVTATTSSGNIDVTVPDDEYRVDIQTDSGDNITNDLGSDDSGPKISLKADSGNVTLKPV